MEAFDSYTKQFDMTNRITVLKYNHSYRVSKLSNMLASNLNLNKQDVELATLIGLIHDIGRFEQIKKFNIISDKVTNTDHANESCVYLFDNGHIRDFIKDNKYDSIILKAIINHNKLKILDDVTEEEKVFVNIIRDADKMDIFRVRKIDYKNEFILPPSTTVLKCIKEEKSVSLTDIKNKSDSILCVLAFIFDFNFKESFILLKELGYYHELLDTIEVSDENKEIFNKIKERLLNKFEV